MPYAPEKCDPPLDAYSAFCAKYNAEGRLRVLPARSRMSGLRVDFSHNDYLGFAHHPKLIHAARIGAARFGVGATGSRLLSGDSLPAHALERRIASMKDAPRALVFSSGFVLNATVIAALLDRQVLGVEPLVFCDRYVHASIYHACAAAGVRMQRYHHQDLDHLELLLRRSMPSTAPRFIITESIFGMDGDFAPIAALRSLAADYRATLYIDEAHATGLYGRNGTGRAQGVVQDGGLVMGTFSKALGGSGAYLACSASIYAYMLQRCGGFIYSTAPAPPALTAALTAWRLLPDCDDLRAHVLAKAAYVRREIQGLGYDIGMATSHLIPLIFPDLATTTRARDHLTARGIGVSLIRPPTVPPNATRIRIAICATHDDEAIALLLDALRSFA